MTEELRVPTVPLVAEIRYFDERPLRGKVFIPARAYTHEGAMRPDEWINQSTNFFPFLADGAKRAQILNKRYVVVLTIEDMAVEAEPLAEFGFAQRVRVECGTLTLEGVVSIEMPETQRRLLDFMNRPELFLTVRDGSRCHIIQKHRITAIAEIVED